MKIAIIGSGISGLSAAYYLSKKHKVDLFEKEDHFGGHAHTINVMTGLDEKVNTPVDIGFIVFNHLTYPNLINFFDEIDVNIEKSNMSFSVTSKNHKIEYCGKGINGIFSNRKNLFNLKFLKMFFEIIKFYKKNSKTNNNINNQTLESYLASEKLSTYFINYHIIPMVSAIWSMPPDEAKKMPIHFFLNFFQNHGLFKLRNRPQWYTVSNRSKTYVEKVLNKISGEYFKNYEVKKIKRSPKNVSVYYGEENEYFSYDKVVIATHANDALSILDEPTDEEKDILSKFNYKTNIAYIHSDKTFMPKNINAWSSWNSIIDTDNLQKNSVTYWLNLLQNLNLNDDIFLTLNPFFEIDKSKIFKIVKFTHPYYNFETIKFQKKLKTLQNKNNTLFCGSYFGYGFHEDGIKSSLDMVRYIND